jgi:hypothetical protein
MPIVKANELDFKDKKIKMIIAGYAGIGKTTLSLSAPKPLLFDLDKGIDRVETPYRKDTVLISDYEQLIKDLTTEDLSSYETFVIDTGGKLLDLMKPFVIKENAQNGQRDGSLSIKGWGAVAQEFKRFNNLISDLKKHVIYIFHTREETDGDVTKLRISIEGSSKNKIWEDMDLGCFVEMQGKNRTIGFSNTERYYAKGTHGIKGIYTIPTLNEGDANDFLSQMFTKVIDDLQSENIAFSQDKKKYEKAMKIKIVIDSTKEAEQLNNVLEAILNVEHALTSEKELKTHLMSKAKVLGLSYDKDTKKFI